MASSPCLKTLVRPSRNLPRKRLWSTSTGKRPSIIGRPASAAGPQRNGRPFGGRDRQRREIVNLHLEDSLYEATTLENVESAILGLDGLRRTLLTVERGSGHQLTVGDGPNLFVAEVAEDLVHRWAPSSSEPATISSDLWLGINCRPPGAPLHRSRIGLGYRRDVR